MQSNLSKSFCQWLLAHLFDKFDNKNLQSQCDKKMILDLYKITNDKNYSKWNNFYIIGLKFTKSLNNTSIFMEGFPLIPRTPPLSLQILIVE